VQVRRGILRRQVLTATVWLPRGLAAGAVVSLVAGAAVFLARRSGPQRRLARSRFSTAPRARA